MVGSGHSAKLPPLPSASLIRCSAKRRVGHLGDFGRPGSPSLRQPASPRRPAPAPRAAIRAHASPPPPPRRALPSAPTSARLRPRAARCRPLPVRRPRARQSLGHAPAPAPAPAPACGRAWPTLPRRPTNAEEPALPPAAPRGPPAPTPPVPDPVLDSGDPDPNPDTARPYPRRPSGFGNLTVQRREEPVGAKSKFLSLCRSAYTASPRHYTDPPWPR
ncbi:predicted GPI-anchored protein 58 [Miscanthus floridulus]|uniref:predicted GPI-anchored protein 58 n=1 Tax=Miscanthus floridulus TaxID=154761 RepID=UPI00345B3459